MGRSPCAAPGAVTQRRRTVPINLGTVVLSIGIIVRLHRFFSKCHQQCICLKSRLWCIQKKCLRRTVLCEPEAQDSQDDWLYGPAQHRHYLPLSATLFEVPPAMHLPKVEPMVFLEEVLAPHPVLCEPETQDSPDEFLYGRAQHRHHRRCRRLFSKCNQQCICLKSRLWYIRKRCFNRTLCCGSQRGEFR